jgi:histidinol-phosphate aminotransferase
LNQEKSFKIRKEIIELDPYVPGEQPGDPTKIIKLNTNENPYPPSPSIDQATREILDRGLLRLYPNPNSDSLRVALASIYGIEKDQILVTNGSDEAIRILFQSVLESGDSYAYPDPTYSAYPVFADTTLERLKPKPIPLREDLSFDWEKLKKTDSKLYCFANPNAPTSLLESKESVLSFVDSVDGMVLCDEAYIDFAEPGSSLIQETKSRMNLVVSRTFSKAYSLAGLRVGFLVGHPEFIQLLYKIKDSYNVGMLDQSIARAAVLDQDYFQDTRNKIIQTRKDFREKLQSLGFFVPESSTNFVFARPPKGISPQELFEYLKTKKIFVRYFAKGIASQFIRITIGQDEEMEVSVQEINAFLEKQKPDL